MKTNTKMKDGKLIPNMEEEAPFVTDEEFLKQQGKEAPQFEELRAEIEERAKKARAAKGHPPE